MNNKFLKFGIAIAALAAIAVPSAFGRKVGYRLKPIISSEEKEEQMTAGSFMVASNCPSCNNGYTIDQIQFSGFSKPQGSFVETFFITNNTNRVLKAVNLYIDYRDLQDRQLHKQFLRLSCNIPPGETRMVEIRSWDRNRSFHHKDSPAGSHPGTPFTVEFDPIAYYLAF